uniref:Uncharacterized protein n=1 Tax=Castor canadensis TaxID=51338 RepID=A0A8C0XYZ8_CASCN
VRHAGQLLLGAALEVVPALLHLLAGALPAGDAVDLGGDAIPHAPPLGHAHPTALRAIELRVVGAHLADQDLILFEGEARFAQPGGLLRFARRPGRRGHGAPRRRRPASCRMGGAGAAGRGCIALAGARCPRVAPARAVPPSPRAGLGAGAPGCWGGIQRCLLIADTGCVLILCFLRRKVPLRVDGNWGRVWRNGGK